MVVVTSKYSIGNFEDWGGNNDEDDDSEDELDKKEQLSSQYLIPL